MYDYANRIISASAKCSLTGSAAAAVVARCTYDASLVITETLKCRVYYGLVRVCISCVAGERLHVAFRVAEFMETAVGSFSR